MLPNLRSISTLFLIGIVFLITSNVQGQDLTEKETKNKLEREQAAEIWRKSRNLILRGRNPDVMPRIRRLISDNLAVGTSPAMIIAFFEKQKIPYSYDQLASRYRGIVRDVGHDPGIRQSIVIYIYVDESKNFVRAELQESFTVP